MADKYDSYLTILHRQRQIKGALRQPGYRTALAKLQKTLLITIREPHPYRLVVNDVVDQMKPLLAVPEFKSGAQGGPAAPGSDYIYHLTSIRKVVGDPKSKSPRTLTWTHFPPAFPKLDESDRHLFEYLLDKYIREYGRTGWMALKDYAAGKYSVKRDFTWWTNEKFPDANIICAAHRVGLPNTWVPKYALVMRCLARKVTSQALSHVPTVLDGFLSEIFSPADYRSATPTWGQAIDLDSPGPLSARAEEYSMNPIPVEAISFRPVLIDNNRRRRHVVARDPRLWQLLELYYDKL